MSPMPAQTTTARGVPVHVAIIMDGNGRWAAERGLKRAQGHRRGAESVKIAAECAIRLGVRYLTVFGFSSENWTRPQDEIGDLMGLLRHYLQREVGFLHENRVRLRVIGDRQRLAPDIVRAIESAEAATREHARLDLTVALSYGGRAEIVAASRRLIEDVVAGRIADDAVDEVAFQERLYTSGIPDPDLVIRTSGEKRISNFLLWQVAYAELVFLDTFWPDFSRQDFEQAVREFARRERRYGSVPA